MAHERGTYLKSIPTRLAELIGYKILPGIAALEGDGVPKAEVQRLLRRAESDAQRLLTDCETVRLRLKGGIEHEYRAMRRRESELVAIMDAAEALVTLTLFAPQSTHAMAAPDVHPSLGLASRSLRLGN
jgi:hypothetical protein